MQVVVVEADPVLQRSIVDGLGREGLTATASTTLEGVDPGQIVVIGLVEGWAGICRRLRDEHPAIRIVVLAGPRHSITALESGADDVLQRDGLSLRELALRLRAVGRRSGVPIEDPVSLEVGGLVVDLVNRTVELDGDPIAVTRAELRVLAVLAASPGRVVDRETLVLRAWGEDPPARRTVDSLVRRLRLRLGWAGDLIETVRGVGYRLDAQSSPARRHPDMRRS